MMIHLVSFFLVALLGFTAHRASICTVKAVAEVLSTHQVYLFLSFAKTVLWVMAISLPIAWLAPMQSLEGYAPTALALAGGFLFGVGATLNGGCAFSTLAYLADGDLGMLASLIGYCAGVAGWLAVTLNLAIPAPPMITLSLSRPGRWTLVLLSVLWLGGSWELIRLWRSRPPVSWRHLLFATHYRLSTAAVILGLSSGVLYTLHGSWTYTTTLQQEVAGWLGFMTRPSMFLIGLFVALFAGMLLSAWQRGSLRPRWRPASSWLRRLLGGTLMGVGGAAIPGGNDALLLRSIPLWSPHAWPTYAALVAGIAVALLLWRWLTGDIIRVECAKDICGTTERTSPGLKGFNRR